MLSMCTTSFEVCRHHCTDSIWLSQYGCWKMFQSPGESGGGSGSGSGSGRREHHNLHSTLQFMSIVVFEEWMTSETLKHNHTQSRAEQCRGEDKPKPGELKLKWCRTHNKDFRVSLCITHTHTHIHLNICRTIQCRCSTCLQVYYFFLSLVLLFSLFVYMLHFAQTSHTKHVALCRSAFANSLSQSQVFFFSSAFSRQSFLYSIHRWEKKEILHAFITTFASSKTKKKYCECFGGNSARKSRQCVV